MSVWTCQFPGCGSSEAQLAELRARRPAGFAHDEDPSLRVCTVCRRLPLVQREAPLDATFLAGIKEELASIEESEQNIQSLSQVFRYYARNAKQLAQLIVDFMTKQCFPWELLHALHLLDDILLMDNTGCYKTELTDRIHGIAVHAFRKVQSEAERREVARILHAWQELRIFDFETLSAVKATLRATGEAACRILDEASADDDLDEVAPPASAAPKQAGASSKPRLETPAKKAKVEAAPVAAPRPAAKIAAIIQRILAAPVERPFEMLGLKPDCQASEIRTAYRKIALVIHPDKNLGAEQCKEALIKLQQGREQAESDLQLRERGGRRKSDASADNIDLEVKPSNKCPYPGCDLPPCKQCPNRCCTRNITHCHMVARSKGGLHCYFHPPPRSWARNAPNAQGNAPV